MNTPMNTLNTQIYEEASEWMILHRGDDLDAEAKRRFDAWLRESPQHLRAYLEMSTIWEDVPTLQHDWNPSANELIARARGESNVFPLGVETVPVRAEAVEAPRVIPAEAGIQLATEASKEPELHAVPTELLEASKEPELKAMPIVTIPASQSTRIKLLAIAATLLVTIGTGWLYLQQRGVYTTDIGEQRTLALTDGSTVELNAQTKIRIAYTDNQRTIELLQGQALFKVAKDPNRPFIVDTEGATVRAVGTQFDVYKKNIGTQITVVEGRVAVASPPPPGEGQGEGAFKALEASRQPHAGSLLKPIPGEVLLSAGEQILIAQATPTLELSLPSAADPIASVPDTKVSGTQASGTVAEIKPANIEAATAWTQQRLVFDFTPLTEVAQEFNRYNRRPLVIEDPSLREFNVSGSFSSTDPSLLLRFLREQSGITVVESSTEIRITRQEESKG